MNHPGCFGIAICYNEPSPICRRCKSATECCIEAEKDLVELKKELNVDHLLKNLRKGKAKVSDKFATTLSGLPVKARPIYERMIRCGVDADVELKAGRNPFSTCGPKYMKVTGNMLTSGKPFNRTALKQEMLEANPMWSERTVDSQVSIAWSLLIGLNLAVEHSGHLRVCV